MLLEGKVLLSGKVVEYIGVELLGKLLLEGKVLPFRKGAAFRKGEYIGGRVISERCSFQDKVVELLAKGDA